MDDTSQSSDFNSFDNKLVKLVQKHTCLYDPSNADFKNADAKETIWQRIGELLGKDAKDVKIRWTRLRERFSREKKRMDLDESSLANEKPIGTWFFYNSLAFLEPFIKQRNRRQVTIVGDHDGGDHTMDIKHSSNQNSSCYSDSNMEYEDLDNDMLEKDQRLIGLIKSHAILYSRAKIPQRQQLKALAWRQISKLMNMEASKCRRRWDILKDRYIKEYRLHRRNLDGTHNDGNKTQRKPSWPLFESMHFIQEYIQSKRFKTERIQEQSTLESNYCDNTINDFDDNLIEEEEDLKGVFKQSDGENIVYLETAVQQDNFSNDITYFTNDDDIETRDDTTHVNLIKTHVNVVTDRVTAESNDREVSAFLNIIESKLDTLKMANKNKAMEDILHYCNAMQSYELNNSPKVPTVVLACPHCDLHHQTSSNRH